MHADVAVVSQEYLCAARKLRAKPRRLLFATSFGRVERLAWGPTLMRERFAAAKILRTQAPYCCSVD